MGKSVGNLYVSLGLNTTPFTKGMHDAQGKLSQFVRSTTSGKNAFSALTGSIGTANAVIGVFAGALSAGAIGAAAKQIIELSDSYTQLEGRLRLVTTGAENLAEVQAALFEISQRTRVSTQDTTDTFTKLSAATEGYGVSQKKLLEITETLNKALIVSSSGQGGLDALRQLNQALGSGVLQGDELKSLKENLPIVTKMIADGMGVAVGRLKELGAEGKLTTESVVNALISQSSVMDEKFAKMSMTVGEAKTKIKNVFESIVVDSGKASGAVGNIVKSLDDFAIDAQKNREIIVNSLATTGTAFLAMSQVASTAIGETISIVEDLADVIADSFSSEIPDDLKSMGNGWQVTAGVILGAKTTIIQAIDAVVVTTKQMGNALMTANDIAAKSILFGGAGNPIDAWNAGIKRDAEIQSEYRKKASGRQTSYLEEIGRILHGDPRNPADEDQPPKGKSNTKETAKKKSGKTEAEKLQDRIDAITKRIDPLADERKSYEQDLKDITKYYSSKGKLTAEGQDAITKLTEQHQKRIDEIAGVTKWTDDLKKHEEKNSTALDLEDKYHQDQIKLLEGWAGTEVEQIADLNALKEEEEARHQAEMVRLSADAENSKTDLVRQAEAATRQLRESAVSNAISLLQRLGDKSKALAIAAIVVEKARAIAQNAIVTKQAAMLAYASQIIPGDPTSPVRAAAAYKATMLLGAVNAGLIAASGVMDIASVSNGSSSSASVSSSGTSYTTDSSGTTTAATTTSNKTITVYGLNKDDLFTGAQVAELLNDYMADGGKLYIK